VGLPLSRRGFAVSQMVRQSQAGASSLAAVRLAGAKAEATEDDQDWADALADGPDDKRRVELGFCARYDRGRPDLSLPDREG
jgi:hypothetical protein